MDCLTPDTNNRCDSDINSTYHMTGFCTIAGPVGYRTRDNYCNSMSTAGEWIYYGYGSGCDYNPCGAVQEVVHSVPFHTCPGCGLLPTGGNGTVCQRFKYTGEPLTCCLNDYDCNTFNDALCFSDKEKQKTCANGKLGQPNYRSVVSTDCQDILAQYCTGTLPTDDPNSTAWLDRWTLNGGGLGSCQYIIERNIFQNPPCIIPPNVIGPKDSQGYFWSQNLVSSAMTKYQQQGFQIGSMPGFSGYNPWQDYLLANICIPYPGLCQSGVTEICASQTAKTISYLPSIAQWCGCNLPDLEYQAYSAKFNIPPECTPMCNRIGTIPITGINGDPVTCQQNVCLIDGVSVNLISSQVGGGLNFNQVCGNCPGGNCSCIISNTTVDIKNSTVGGNVIPINSNCGSLTCSQTNPGSTGPVEIPIECGTTGNNPFAIYDAKVTLAKKQGQKNALFWTLIVIGSGLLLIFLIIFFINPSLKPLTKHTIPRQPPITNREFARASDDYDSINGPTPTSDFARNSNDYTSINGSYSFNSNSPSINSNYQSIE